MSEKTKKQSDRRLIKEIFALDPIDWARYPDGKLVFISPTGQKFGYSLDQLDNISEAVRQERAGKKKLSSKDKKDKLFSESDVQSDVDTSKSNGKNRSGGRGG